MASKYSSTDEMIELFCLRGFVSLLTKMSQIWRIFKFSGPRGGGGGGGTPSTPSENEQYDLYFDDAKYLALFQKCNIFPLSYPTTSMSEIEVMSFCLGNIYK